MEVSKISEDAGAFCQANYEMEPKRKYSFGKTEEKIRRLSLRSDNPNTSLKTNESQLVISPEDVPDEYEQSANETGLLVVFNHENFQTYDPRTGTMKDQEDLIDCLSRLRYEVRREFLFKDLIKTEIEEQLQKVSRMDYSKRSSLIVVFLTHGDTEGKLFSSDGFHLTCEEVWNYFSADKCPSLKGKPKIFIFQACKGKQKSTLRVVEEDSMRRETAKKNYTLPAEADILIAYSTVEGNVSFRDPDSGTWFIQELCKNLTAYGRRDDLVSIITRVSKCVAYHYQHESYKQMPTFISTLTRKFYLCKSKERGCLLDLYEQYRNMLTKIENLEMQLEGINKKDKDNKQKRYHRTPVDMQVKKATSASKITNIEKPRWKN